MKEPETIEELAEYIEHYADTIFIRERLNGKWGSYALGELPLKLALRHAMRFIIEGRIPVRVLDESERPTPETTES